MHYRNERIYTLDLGYGVSAKEALIGLAIAGFRLAPALADDDELHPDYRPNADLGISAAVDYIRDSGITMLFAKGRMPLLHVEVLNKAERSLTLRVAMSWGDDDEQLLALADEIVADLFGTAPPPPEDDLDFDIDVEPDIGPATIDLSDEDIELCLDDVRSLAPMLQYAA